MNYIFAEIIIVLFLILLEAFFAGSEISLISVRRTRIGQLVKRGNRRAKIIQSLQSAPETLFATAQIGISILTIVASAFAGTSLAQALSVYLQSSDIYFISYNAYAISFVLVVVVVSYITLVIGELVPKSLAIRYPESFALIAAYPIWVLSKILYWVIRFLTFSSNLILKPFHDSTSFSESRLSEEEIRTLIREGKQAGTIAPREHEILENVFEFSDTAVSKIMTPRSSIIAFDINDTAKVSIPKVIEQGFTRVPFYDGSLDKVLGFLHVKDLLPYFGKSSADINIRKLLLPVFFVPGSQKINDVLAQFQKKKVHEALVTNEHGGIEGLITLEDVLEELVGEISDEDDEQPKEFIKEKDGSITVSGQASVVDFNKYFSSALPEDETYNTLSGFILEKLGRFAESGDYIEQDNLKFTVKEAADRTVKSVSVKKKLN